jgi:RHS repeat-associated protein
VGNITIQQDAAQQTVYFDGAVVSPDKDYTYDALYRLIQAEGREHAVNTSPPSTAEASWNDTGRTGLSPLPSDYTALRRYIQYYGYDEVGNMLEMKHTCTDSSQNWTRDFTIDSASNRLLSADVLYSPVITEDYTYDNRGNLVDGMSHLGNPLLSPPEYAMTYNELNRLEKVIVNADITCYYQYDSNGQRVRKVKVDDNPSGYTHVRKYVGQWELYSQLDMGSSPPGDLVLARESLHVMDDQARVALIDTETTATTPIPVLRYQFSNHLGTASLELDEDAEVISYEEYYPFGSTSFQCGPNSDLVSLKRYRYTGKERDEETGLYYHGARYYAPWLARWCAVDPLESKFSPQSSYHYGNNNPIIWCDPTGKEGEEKKGTIAPASGQSTNEVDTIQKAIEIFKKEYPGANEFIEKVKIYNNQAILPGDQNYNSPEAKNINIFVKRVDLDEIPADVEARKYANMGPGHEITEVSGYSHRQGEINSPFVSLNGFELVKKRTDGSFDFHMTETFPINIGGINTSQKFTIPFSKDFFTKINDKPIFDYNLLNNKIGIGTNEYIVKVDDYVDPTTNVDTSQTSRVADIIAHEIGHLFGDLMFTKEAFAYKYILHNNVSKEQYGHEKGNPGKIYSEDPKKININIFK